jgi:hypothetical protein
MTAKIGFFIGIVKRGWKKNLENERFYLSYFYHINIYNYWRPSKFYNVKKGSLNDDSRHNVNI